MVAALPDHKDLRDRLGLPDPLAQRVRLVPRDPLEQLGLKARQARMARPDLPVQPDLLALRVFPVLAALRDPSAQPALKVLQERLGLRDPLVLPSAFKVRGPILQPTMWAMLSLSMAPVGFQLWAPIRVINQTAAHLNGLC